MDLEHRRQRLAPPIYCRLWIARSILLHPRDLHLSLKYRLPLSLHLTTILLLLSSPHSGNPFPFGPCSMSLALS